MALGGGTFLVQNKVLPGAYINFISVAKASANLADRGYCTMPLELDWGVDDEVFEVTNGDFQKNSTKIFGYDYTHSKLKVLRDLFLNAQTLFAYKLNNGGAMASNEFATAKYSGIRGNDLKTIIQQNVDDATKFDVSLLLENDIVDFQTVTTAKELKANDFVTFKADATLELTVATPLTGGTNGVVSGLSHQTYLDKIESYSFNTMGCTSDEDVIKLLYCTYNKRMRDEVGAKFQLVVHNMAFDYEGVINVKNDTVGDKKQELVYWVTGAECGCLVNKSVLNKCYDGEFEMNTHYTQALLTKAINDGEFVFHKVDNEIRVLSDINSMVTVSDTKGDVFKDNQTMRVCDQIANDIASLFNTRYLGTVPNDEAGRTALWADIVKHHEQLQVIRAIENFKDSDVVVLKGDTKKSVVVNDIITPINVMAQLYMTVKVV